MSALFKRLTLDQLCDVPDDIIDVNVVERHISGRGNGRKRSRVEAEAACRAPDRARLFDRPGEAKNKKGKRESLYQFYESGLAKKSTGKSKGIFVAVKTLVGQGGGTIGVTDTGRTLTEYILDAVQDQFHAENGEPISLNPVELLADRFRKR